MRYKSYHYQAASCSKARRVVAEVEHHQGELFSHLGFLVTNMALPSRSLVRFYNRRGTAEQWIKEGKQATGCTGCRAIAAAIERAGATCGDAWSCPVGSKAGP